MARLQEIFMMYVRKTDSHVDINILLMLVTFQQHDVYYIIIESMMGFVIT